MRGPSLSREWNRRYAETTGDKVRCSADDGTPKEHVMTITNDNVQYEANYRAIYVSSSTLSGSEILGVSVAAVMLLLLLPAGGTDYSKAG